MKNDWRPDWKNEQKYPNPRNTSPEEWAWEFVRRNHEYQKDYESLVAGLPPLKTQKDNWSKYEPVNKEIRKHFSQKFGVSYARSPSKRFSKNLKFERQPVIITKPRIKKYEINYGEVLVSFDLLKPINPQLKKIKIELEKQKDIFHEIYKEPENKKRAQTEKYQTYLRVLDAKYAKVKNSEIAKILYPDEENLYPDYASKDKVKKDYLAAKRLQNQDYFFIS